MMSLPAFSRHEHFSCKFNYLRPHAILWNYATHLGLRARRALISFTSLLDCRAFAPGGARPFFAGIAAMSGPCFVCGKPHSPFGFGLPGPRSEKPKGKRGYLWACADHRKEGEERRRKAIGGRLSQRPDDISTTNQKGPTE